MRFAFLVALIAAALSEIGYAQSKPAAAAPISDRPLVIRITKSIPVPSDMAGALVGPIACDSDGNVFLRKHQEKVFQASILKIDSHGTRQAQYSVTDADPKLNGGEFFVTTDGEVMRGSRAARNSSCSSTARTANSKRKSS